MTFSDLFKAFDTSNHSLLIVILVKYGAPTRLFSSIKRIYEKILVNIIIGKIETSIYFKVGVKQEDIIDPVIFLFLMTEFSKTLEDDWTAPRTKQIPIFKQR